MNPAGNINLIKNTNDVPEFLLPVARQYRALSIIILFAVILSGVLTVSAYVIITARGVGLAKQKQTLLTRLEAQKVKETLFIAVKNRVKVAETTLKTIHDKSVLITRAVDIAGPPQLLKIYETDKQRVLAEYKTNSIEESISLAGKVENLISLKSMKDVYLTNFSVSGNMIRMSFDFMPVW